MASKQGMYLHIKPKEAFKKFLKSVRFGSQKEKKSNVIVDNVLKTYSQDQGDGSASKGACHQAR